MTNKMAARALINLRARIAKLWQFKARKVDKIKEDDPKRVFSDAAKNGTIFSCN